MQHSNQKMKFTASVFGSLIAVSAILNHAIFEIFQGMKPTNGFLIKAIDISHQFWKYGTEEAITILPTFLLAGLTTILIATLIIIWSIKIVSHRHGALIFLLLIIALTLVGGGIAHMIFSLCIWGWAIHINKSLVWWQRVLPPMTKSFSYKMWVITLLLTSIFWLFTMQLGIFGYLPSVQNPEVILNVVYIFLLSTVLMCNASFVFALTLDRHSSVQSFAETIIQHASSSK